MPVDKSLQSRFAEATKDLQDALVPRVAKLMRPVPGNVNVSKQERWRRWWQEEAGWTPEHEAELLAGGMSREDVGILKYPAREIDARAFGGMNDERGQAKYAQEMTDLGPPPPDPLEQAAQQVEQPPEPAPLATPVAQPPMPDATGVPEMGGY